MCWKFISVFSRQQDVMFVANYMLDQLASHITDSERDELRLTHIGSRVSITFIKKCTCTSTMTTILVIIDLETDTR